MNLKEVIDSTLNKEDNKSLKIISMQLETSQNNSSPEETTTYVIAPKPGLFSARDLNQFMYSLFELPTYIHHPFRGRNDLQIGYIGFSEENPDNNASTRLVIVKPFPSAKLAKDILEKKAFAPLSVVIPSETLLRYEQEDLWDNKAENIYNQALLSNMMYSGF